jgi:formylglycine-generating enzyme required for sulfatase activity
MRTFYAAGERIRNSPAPTSEVGWYLPDSLGIYDLHGNVWELMSAVRRRHTAGHGRRTD